MLDTILKKMSILLREFTLITPLLLFVAGFLTSMTPCSLTSVPLVMGVLTGTGVDDKRTGRRIAIVFSIGMVLTFTLLGVMGSSLGARLAKFNDIFNFIVALILILMSFQLLGLINIVKSKNLMSKNKHTGYFGAFFTGILGGLFSSPCATPVLISLIALSSRSGNVLISVLMFVSFGIGHSLITIFAGSGVGKIWEIIESEKYQKISNKFQDVLGYSFFLIGFLMLLGVVKN